MQHIETRATLRNEPNLKHHPSRSLWVAAIIGVMIAITIVAGALYIWFSGGSGQPSAPITAPSLELQPGDSRRLLSITSGASEARFIIDEILLGEPKTVVGVTDQVAGEMLIDLDNPQNSVLGVIRVNVRTLETDNEFRNRALRGQILQADRPEYEFATFTPTRLNGLPEQITVGEAFTFQVTGMLNLHGVNREVSFDTTVTATSETQIQGTANTVVQYRDFGMSIPEAAGVAGVADEVRLEINFTAQTAQ